MRYWTRSLRVAQLVRELARAIAAAPTASRSMVPTSFGRVISHAATFSRLGASSYLLSPRWMPVAIMSGSGDDVGQSVNR